jgi:acetylornithine deacetylase
MTMETDMGVGKTAPLKTREITALTKKLVEVSSPSGRENGVAELIAPRLRKNFDVRLQKVGDRYNVIALRGEPEIILTAHMDTVPGTLKICENKEFIYGRGSCDAKGAIAAMILAAEDAVTYGASNFGLVFDVGEEDSFDGVMNAVSTLNPKLVVLGEPSSLNLVTRQKGLLQLSITKKGKSAPASMPSRGVSAIELLTRSLNKLLSLKPTGKDEDWGQTMNIGTISGGTAPNVVADEAKAVIDIRTVSDNSAIFKTVSAVLGGGIVKDLDFQPSVSDAGCLPEILGVRTAVMPYFTEMYFWGKKAKAVVLGPGNYSVAHTNKEKVSKREILTAKEKYLKILTDARVRDML